MFANLVEEAGKMGGYILECFVAGLSAAIARLIE